MDDLSPELVARSRRLGWKATDQTELVWCLRWYLTVGGEVEMSYRIVELSFELVARSGRLGWKATERTQSVWLFLRWCLTVGGEVEMS